MNAFGMFSQWEVYLYHIPSHKLWKRIYKKSIVEEKKLKECKSQRLRGHYWEIVISGHNTHELTAASAANTRPVEGQVNQHSCMKQEGVHKPHLQLRR